MRSGSGDLLGARALQEEVLTALVEIHGPNHPSTIGPRRRLSTTLRRMGKLDEACALQEATLEICSSVLPPDHTERLDTVTLPTWAAPPVMLQPLSATSRAMKIGLTSDEYSLIDMSMTSYWRIRQRLMQVPGVANVAMWGERLEMLQVQVDPERMSGNE